MTSSTLPLHSAAQHGTASGYNTGCRCYPCSHAKREQHQTQRERRFAQRTLVDGVWHASPLLKHGTTNTYGTWGCRCELCRDAIAAYQRDLYQRRLYRR